MNRRRRASSIASRATDDEVESSPVENTRKKRRVDPVYVISNRKYYIINTCICIRNHKIKFIIKYSSMRLLYFNNKINGWYFIDLLGNI